MRYLIESFAVVVTLAVGPGLLADQLVNIPMNEQINVLDPPCQLQSPDCDAIYEPDNFGDDSLVFTSDPGDPDPAAVFTRVLMSNQQEGGDGWYYTYIDFELAGIGSVDISKPCTTIEFDGRVYQDPVSNSNQYADANIFVRLYSYEADGETLLGFRTYGADNGNIVYGPNASQFPFGDWYPTWSHIVIDANENFTDDDNLGFDPTDVDRVRFFGTDWSGGGDDFTDLRNFVIQTPDIDIDSISAQVRQATNDPCFDVNGDARVNQEDRRVWVEEITKTYFGDSNLDGEFNSSDLVVVFQAGQYEDGVSGNSTWATGDWNGDLEFDSTDFITAFQAGGYEVGPRAAVGAVPEPGSLAIVSAALLCASALGCCSRPRSTGVQRRHDRVIFGSRRSK